MAGLNHSLGESTCAFIEGLFSWILNHTSDIYIIIFLYESSYVFALCGQCWMFCHILDMLDIIIFCRAFSGFNLHIVCIKFLREAFRYDYPGWVFFFFLISYFSASFSSVFIYHFFNCFLNLFGFSVLSSSGMML